MTTALTPEDCEVLGPQLQALINDGQTIDQCCKILGRGRKQIYRVISAMKLTRPPEIGRRHKNTEIIRGLIEKGKTREEIAQITGLCRSYIAQMIKSDSLPIPVKAPAIVPEHRLEKIATIRNLIEQGKPLSEIIQITGLKRSTIYKIRLTENMPKPVPTPQLAQVANEKEVLRSLIEDGKNIYEMAAIMGCTHNSVRGKIYRAALDIKPTWARTKLTSDAQDALIVELYPTNAHTNEILQRLNALPGRAFNPKTLINRAQKLGVKRPNGYVPLRARRDAPPKKRVRVRGGKLRPARQNPWTKYQPKAPPPQPTHSPVYDDNPPPADWQPGGARPPVGAEWEDIRYYASLDGFSLTNKWELPGYNRSRQRRNLAPYAINIRR